MAHQFVGVDDAARGDTELMPGGVLQLHRWGLLEAVVAAGTPAVRAGQFSYGDDVETVEVAAAGLRHVWEAAARVPVSDGHSCREHCDAAMVPMPTNREHILSTVTVILSESQ